jgi:hypothetical protein
MPRSHMLKLTMSAADCLRKSRRENPESLGAERGFGVTEIWGARLGDSLTEPPREHSV